MGKTRLFITGANGFIGKNLISVLNRMPEYMVVAGVGNTWEKTASDREGGTGYVKCDISDDQFVPFISAKVEKCDVIIHLAAYISMEQDDRLIAVNVNGTSNIAKLANEWKVRKVIYISSIPVIGVPVVHPIDETHPLFPQTLYHATKLSGEFILQACCDKQTDVISLRIPSPIGCGMNKKNFLSLLLEKCRSNEEIILFGHGGRKQNYIDVRDVCRAILEVVVRDAKGVFCIGGTCISNEELAKTCIALSDSKSPIIFKGMDKEEDNIWDISFDKASGYLGYEPGYSLEDTIRWLLGQ